MAKQRPLITGVFPDRESAEKGYSTLASRGYTTNDIDLVMSEDTKKRHFKQALAAYEAALGRSAARARGGRALDRAKAEEA